MDNILEGFDFLDVDTQFYGVTPHENALKIADYEFFWDCYDELAPFGSEEGYISFLEVEKWINENPGKPLIDCMVWILKSWDLNIVDYNEKIIEDDNILKLMQDYGFDELILTLDVTIIATGFGQLIIQGKIDEDVKDIVHLAILRQMKSVVLDSFLGDNEDWKYERFKYLEILLDILKKA